MVLFRHRKTANRREKYELANRLYSRGVAEHLIAKSVGCGIEFVDMCINAASWPANRRNAWLMGLNVEKFNVA